MNWYIRLIYSLILRYGCILIKGSRPFTCGTFTQAIYGIYPDGQKWYCADATMKQFLDRYVI